LKRKIVLFITLLLIVFLSQPVFADLPGNKRPVRPDPPRVEETPKTPTAPTAASDSPDLSVIITMGVVIGLVWCTSFVVIKKMKKNKQQ